MLTSEVETAVRGVVQALEDAFNAHDADALGETYARNATWTNAMGHVSQGREAITEAARRVLPMLAEQFVRYEVTGLLPVRPDVIAVNVVQSPVTEAGEPVEGPKGAPLYVVSREDEGWRIIAGSNTFRNS
ncbi:SgcJ/EcaC family oxidoreductase [Streptomyces albireticuli]|uniref:SgcJ/EcaC family oxidoreductase n=1 Tax=Streptomyces albireticuli TaxID=1940 RepID=UPI0036B89864